MVNIDFAELDDKVRTKANGNIAEYIRNLVREDLKKDQLKLNFFLYQIIIMVFASFSIMIFTISLLTGLFLLISLGFIILVSIMLFFDAIFLFILRKKEVLKTLWK